MTRLAVGDPAPPLDLVAEDGRTVTLEDFAGDPLVLYFLPKAFTPGCTAEACEFRDRTPDFIAAGYRVIGVSPDTPEVLAAFRQEHDLGHRLLSDPDSGSARRWGAYGDKVVGGVPTTGPLRTTIVLDATGTVVSAEYELDPRGHAATLLASLVAPSS